MLRSCLWIGLVLILAGCGKPHAELELQHRIVVLEQQVQELQQQEAAEKKVSPQGQEQQEKSESLPATPDTALELSPNQEEESAQDAKLKKKQEKEPAKPEEPQDQVRQEYKQALDTLLQGKPDQAQSMFQEFLKKYKKHELTPNVYYWLGECHYEKQSFAEAILAFKEVSNQYPDSDKVPDALLKMGFSYLNMGQESNASFYLETLRERYPDSKAAELAQEKLAELES